MSPFLDKSRRRAGKFPPPRERPGGLRRLALALSLSLAAGPGCAYFRGKSEREDQSLALLGAGESVEVRNAVQSEVMDFADQYILHVAQAMDEFRNRVNTPEARVKAQAWKVGHANAVLIIAANPNSFVGVMDLIVLVTLGRMVIEEHWMEAHGEEARPVLEAYANLERDVWELARKYLNERQEEELRALIQDWRAKHPDQRYVSLIRFRDFAVGRQELAAGGGRGVGSLFELLYLDPFAKLDPAVRESEQVRSMGNRLLFQMQRLPSLVSWQAELLVYRLLRTSELQSLSKDLSRFTGAAEVFSQAVSRLPEEIRNEREMLLADLEEHGPLLRGLLDDFTRALAVGGESAGAVEAAARAIDELVPERRPQEEEAPPTSPPNPATPSPTLLGTPPRRPFDVTEYEAAAAEISGAAQRLTVLVDSLDRLIQSPAWEERAVEVREVVQEARAEAEGLLHRAFLLGAALILILAAAVAAAVVVARGIPSRNCAGEPRPPGRAETR